MMITLLTGLLPVNLPLKCTYLKHFFVNYVGSAPLYTSISFGLSGHYPSHVGSGVSHVLR